MSDDLVKRLRKRCEAEMIDGYERVEFEDEDAIEAADRIEELERQLAEARDVAAFDLAVSYGKLRVARNAGLEEAAKWLDNYDDFHAERFASLVRALKDKP